jgi:hypothetical protein
MSLTLYSVFLLTTGVTSGSEDEFIKSDLLKTFLHQADALAFAQSVSQERCENNAEFHPLQMVGYGNPYMSQYTPENHYTMVGTVLPNMDIIRLADNTCMHSQTVTIDNKRYYPIITHIGLCGIFVLIHTCE